MTYEHPLAYPHVDFEKDFSEYCVEKGYKVIDLAYHHNYNSTTQNLLRRDNSTVSLSVRLSPDIIIQKDGLSCFCELKTGTSNDIIRMEAYQLMLNQIRETQFFTDCLYIYRGAMSYGDIIACHAKDIKPSLLVIPSVEKNRIIKPILENYFDCEQKEKRIGSQYSGDAYIEINDISNWEPIDVYIK